MRRMAVLWDANTGPYQLRGITVAAKAAAIDVQVLEFRDAVGMEGAPGAGLKQRPQVLIGLGAPLANHPGKRIADFAANNRLPGISPFRSFSEAGGLMSYGPNLLVLFRQLAPHPFQDPQGREEAR